MLLLNTLNKISDLSDVYCIELKDMINPLTEQLTTFRITGTEILNKCTLKDNKIYFHKKYYGFILQFLIKHKFMVTTKFCESSSSFFSNSTAFTFGINNKKLKEDFTKIPKREFIPKCIKRRIYDLIWRLNLNPIVTNILCNWILESMPYRCFLKFICFFTDLTNKFISLPAFFTLLSKETLNASKLLTYPDQNVTLVLDSNIFVPLNSQFSSQNNIMIPFLVHGKSLHHFSAQHIRDIKNIYMGVSEKVKYKMKKSTNYNTQIHSMGNINNIKLVELMYKVKKMRPLTKVNLTYPEMEFKTQYWKDHMFYWNFNFTRFSFLIYGQEIFTCDKMGQLKELLIQNRIHALFKRVFYKIYSCDYKGIKAHYQIDPMKLIEFFTLLFSIHPKHYIHFFSKADNFFEFYETIDELFFGYLLKKKKENDLTNLDSEQLKYLDSHFNALLNEQDAKANYVFNLCRFKYEQCAGPIFEYNLTDTISLYSSLIQKTLESFSEEERNDDDFKIYFID